MANEVVIYTDESDRTGEYCSNFYGGILVRSKDLERAADRLLACKLRHNLHGEIKWRKVTENYLGKYAGVVDELFDMVTADVVKIRIMFTNNQYIPIGLTSEQRQNEYHLLYYQFIKHAFGLEFCTSELAPPVRVRLNIDQMPTGNEETSRFKAYVAGLDRNPRMRDSRVRFDEQQIAEVASHDHVLLQCLDIVLGAMAFRLNERHRAKPVGKSRRASRTLAKHRLYQHISTRIRAIYPGFNIGESTGIQGDPANRWRHPYRHWKFVPRDHRRDSSRAKP
jgi:hypothetical protein